jgi:hypothetical protein
MNNKRKMKKKKAELQIHQEPKSSVSLTSASSFLDINEAKREAELRLHLSPMR